LYLVDVSQKAVDSPPCCALPDYSKKAVARGKMSEAEASRRDIQTWYGTLDYADIADATG
jgi:aspartate aminotransferase-like enzyme